MPTIEELQAELEKTKADAKKFKDQSTSYKKDLDKMKAGGTPAPKAPEKKEEEEDLLSKAKKEDAAKDAASKGDKSLESALSFNLTVSEFVKNNKDILPGDFQKVIDLSNKESYDTPKQKANAVRSGLIQSFFGVQAHVDMLTDNQKKVLADFMKLTKNGKEEQSHTVYENVFEPSFEMLKHLKKAEDKAKTKQSNGTNTTSYKDKLAQGSMNKYFGTKKV